MKPLVTICIPTYNGSKYLRECLDSVLSQTFSDFEVIVVDDQSQDETPSIIQEYAQRDKRIKFFSNMHNLGLVRNWNRCVELAGGEWIKFVFQDDMIASNCLERLLSAYDDKCPLIVCRRTFKFDSTIDEGTRQWYLNVPTVESLFQGKTYISSAAFCYAAIEGLGLNFIGEPVAVMLRKSTLDTFGLFDVNLIGLCDFEYWARVACCEGFIYVPDILATFRVHRSSVSMVTMTSQAFRKDRLDCLILLHNYIFHPSYSIFREQVASKWSFPNLIDLFSKKANYARNLALAQRCSNEMIRPIDAWREVAQLYPMINLCAHRLFPFITKILKINYAQSKC